jgi:hypothetical protein
MNTQLIQQIAEEQILQIFIDVQAELARKIDELYLDDYQSDRLTESIAMVHENNKQKYLRGLATTGELPATVSKGYTSGFEEGFNEGQRKGELPAGPAIDLEHFLDYVGLNYTPVKFNDGVCWDLDDSEAPVSSEEVIQDYEEQFGSTPVAPKEEGETPKREFLKHLGFVNGPGVLSPDVEPVASHSSTSGNDIELDYPAAARVIALYLKPFCNEDLIYTNMIAQAARDAAKRIEDLQEENDLHKKQLAALWQLIDKMNRIATVQECDTSKV